MRVLELTWRVLASVHLTAVGQYIR